MQSPEKKSRAEVEHFYEKITKMKKTDEKGKKMKVNGIFDAFVDSILRDPDTKKSYTELKERGDNFFILLSHELVKEGTLNVMRPTIPHTVKDRFRRSIIDLILAFGETLHETSKNKKTALVDVLCSVFQVPKHVENTASSSSLFSDLGSKNAAYVAVFATEISGLLTILNLFVGACRFVNDDYSEFKISASNMGMMCYTVLATIALNGVSGYGQGFQKNFIKLVCKGLCIALAHYAASYPAITSILFRCNVDTAGAHYLHHTTSEPQSAATLSNTYHAVNFLLSVIWPLITYLAYFGGGSYVKPTLMAMYLANTSGAFMSHTIPRSSRGVLSMVTLSRPDDINWATSRILGRTLPSKKEEIRKSETSTLLLKHTSPPDPWFTATPMVMVDSTREVAADVAKVYALKFLDIMKTQLILWRDPVFGDAFDFFKTGDDGDDMMRTVATMINALSPAPCTFTAMGGYSYDQMKKIAKKIMRADCVNNGKLASAIDYVNGVDSVANLLKPTIQGFLYAYQTRSFSPSSAGTDCLGLEQSHYTRGMKSQETTDFLNRMDSLFFEALKIELGITAENEHQFRGVNRFFVYS